MKSLSEWLIEDNVRLNCLNYLALVLVSYLYSSLFFILISFVLLNKVFQLELEAFAVNSVVMLAIIIVMTSDARKF